jgi:hypothetical protein
VDKTVYAKSLVIYGTTEADVPTLTVNGYNAIRDGDEFQYNITLSPGINTVVIQSKDRAGNVAQEILTVNYATDGGETETNWAAIGIMVMLLVVGLILGLLIAPMIFGGKKEELPEEEVEPLPEEELPPEGEDIEALPEDEPAPEGDMDIESAEAVEGAEPIPAEESLPEELPEEPAPEEPSETEELPAEPEAAPAEEDPRIAKLTQAYESGKISKELYEKNLAKFKGE